MKNIKIVPLILLLTFLSGCWSSSEIDERALVHGAGFDFNEESGLFDTYVEIVKPTGSEDASVQANENLVLHMETDSPLHGAREMIRYAKRRLYFGHTQLWLVGEELAKQPFVPVFDTIRRDSMNRLNSYVFITQDPIDEVFSTTTLYENLSSDEIVSGLEQTEFTPDFIPVRLYDFINLTEERLDTAYLPIINVVENLGEPITSIEGTAVIKDKMMVGELDRDETRGLNLLLTKIPGGVMTVPKVEDKEIISMEVKDGNAEIHPYLDGKDLHVEIQLEIEGELGDNMMVDSEVINEEFMEETEVQIEKQFEKIILDTVEKLQEYEADITNIGVETYRKYPQEWAEIEQVYHDEIFPEATFEINVDADMFHQGLINESVNEPHKKPYNNPFPFFD